MRAWHKTLKWSANKSLQTPYLFFLFSFLSLGTHSTDRGTQNPTTNNGDILPQVHEKKLSIFGDTESKVGGKDGRTEPTKYYN